MRINVKTGLLALAAPLLVVACGQDEPGHEQTADVAAPADAFVQLFEWRWPDVATECESFLGPAGYAAVQVSPAMEHVAGPEWWTRYQPVSYKIESRGGTRAEFADMLRRCAAAGVDVYADAVINHMAGFPEGMGVAGSAYREYAYPVPYDYDDFHHCGHYDDDRIRNYQDLWEVQNCQLGTLDDLDTAKPAVQEKIATYLNDLLHLGVAGFRIDAAKHMSPDDIQEILGRVDGAPLVYQEVIDRGGEPINAMDYVRNGMVTEFKYPPIIVEAFERGNLDALRNFSTGARWLPADKAVVFVDNHDIQRGHAGAAEILNYKDGARYDIAVAFMLAYPYGYPMVMSGYRFDSGDQGPPDASPQDDKAGCGVDWVCEHRHPGIANMVRFRKAVGGTDVVNWKIIDGKVLSFGRGDNAQVIINTSDAAVDIETVTSMPPGQYCDLVSTEVLVKNCTGRKVTVGDNGVISLSLRPLSAVAVLVDD